MLGDIDFYFLFSLKPKLFISDCRLPKHFICQPLESYVYLSNNLSSADYIPPYFCKHYIWQPILSVESRKISASHISLLKHNKNVLPDRKTIMNYQGVRPKILTYDIPIFEEHLETAKDIYFNCQKFSVINGSFNKNFVDGENFIDNYLTM
jgi:hypothetical protein